MADVDNEKKDAKPAATAGSKEEDVNLNEYSSAIVDAQPSRRSDPSVRRVYSTQQELFDIYDLVCDYERYDIIFKDEVCLDPHDNDNNRLYHSFRSRSGGRLTREITERDFILVGFDKVGLSGVLDVPVPPGATLSVQMSTWCNPCHSGYAVEKHCKFGVGMVPFGCGKEQVWRREGFTTCIENGVQYHCELNLDKLRGGGGLGGRGFGGSPFGGLGGMGFLLGLDDPSDAFIDYKFDVMQEGVSIRHSTRTKLSLDVIDVRIRRKLSGESEFSFSHGEDLFEVKCPADANNEDMQLYFNCMGLPDNNTYIQIHKVVYDPPVQTPPQAPATASAADLEEKPTDLSKKRAPVAKAEEDKDDDEGELLDYAKILKADPELREQVNKLIKAKQQKSK